MINKVENTTMQIVVNGLLIRYEVVNQSASKDCIVLHGWGQSGRDWQAVFKQLDDSFRYILVDLPGFGGSELSSSIICLDDYVAVINAFAREMDLGKFSLIGHSFGAQLAVKFADKNPNIINSIVLICPALARQHSFPRKLSLRLLAKLAKFKYVLPVKLRYHISSGMDYSEASESKKTLMRSLLKEDLVTLLPRIIVSTLLVWGEKDYEVLGSAREITRLLQNGEMRVMYGIGHNPHYESRAELICILSDFFQRQV